MNFSDVQNESLTFRDEREWKQFHNAGAFLVAIPR